MSAGTSPIFVTTPKRPQVRISTANTGRSGSGTIGTIVTAGANGAFYKGIHVMPEAAAAAGDVVRIFNQVAGSGNNELLAEILIPPMNPQASGAGVLPIPLLQPIEFWPPAGIVLGAADVLKASTDQGITYSVAAEGGGDY